ncbi:MAG: pyridoxal phosphate-dependent aminotransferase [bacterium]
MNYKRMPIEIESPEQLGYGNIKHNLTESSVSDMPLRKLGIDLNDLALAYTDHAGKPELRAAVAAEGAGLSADDVLITVGAASALFIVATSLLGKGDKIVVAHPNYATNIETPRAIGASIEFLRLSFEDGFRVDLDRLRSLVTEDTKLISLTCPHNPTGAMMSESDVREAIAIAEERNCWLLFDETYREMAFGGALPPAASLSSRVISVASVSKSYGLPGVRMGWLIAKDKKLQELFLAAKEQIFICNSIVDEEIACHALLNKSRILPEILANNKAAFEVVKSWMAGRSDMEWVEPRGGVVCFPRIREDSGVDVDLFYKTLNGKYATHAGPGHWFEMDRRYMRIGYGWPTREELVGGLECVGKALDEAKKQ